MKPRFRRVDAKEIGDVIIQLADRIRGGEMKPVLDDNLFICKNQLVSIDIKIDYKPLMADADEALRP